MPTGHRPAHSRPKPIKVAQPPPEPPADAAVTGGGTADGDSASNVESMGPPVTPEEIANAEIEDLTGEGDEVPAGSVDPPVIRAGGHIDRGDGRGWVVEQDEE